MTPADRIILAGMRDQLAAMLDADSVNIPALHGVSLQCQVVLARLYEAMPALPGSGAASLPSFASEAAAIIHAAELTRRDERKYVAEPVAERWVVRLAKWEAGQ